LILVLVLAPPSSDVLSCHRRRVVAGDGISVDTFPLPIVVVLADVVVNVVVLVVVRDRIVVVVGRVPKPPAENEEEECPPPGWAVAGRLGLWLGLAGTEAAARGGC